MKKYLIGYAIGKTVEIAVIGGLFLLAKKTGKLPMEIQEALYKPEVDKKLAFIDENRKKARRKAIAP